MVYNLLVADTIVACQSLVRLPKFGPPALTTHAGSVRSGTPLPFTSHRAVLPSWHFEGPAGLPASCQQRAWVCPDSVAACALRCGRQAGVDGHMNRLASQRPWTFFAARASALRFRDPPVKRCSEVVTAMRRPLPGAPCCSLIPHARRWVHDVAVVQRGCRGGAPAPAAPWCAPGSLCHAIHCLGPISHAVSLTYIYIISLKCRIM